VEEKIGLAKREATTNELSEVFDAALPGDIVHVIVMNLPRG